MNAPAPSVGAADRIRNPAVPGEHPPRRIVLLTLAAVLVAGVTGGGVWLLASGGVDEVKPRLLSLKTGPMSAMPDLRDGVPALVRPAASPSDERSISQALSKGDAAPPIADEAGRKAMDATLSSAGLRPAMPSGRMAGSGPVDAGRVDQPPGTEPVRSVRPVTTPGATASLTPSPAVTRAEPIAAVTAPVRPAPPEASRATPPTAPSDTRRAASAPAVADAPLPPRRPALPAAELASTPSTPARAATPDRTPPARAREAASRPVAAEAQPARPRRVAEAEEERSVLGVPVPGFIPTGRDISNAASSISNAVTGLAGF